MKIVKKIILKLIIVLKSITYFMEFFLIILLLISLSLAYEEENNLEELPQKFGWVAFSLFSLALVYVIIYQLYIHSRLIFPKNEKFEEHVNQINKFHLRVKKPLSLIHYFASFIAIILLFIHGIPLLGNEAENLIPGLIAGTIYIIYIIVGVLIKVILRGSKRVVKLRKYLFKFHTHLILLIIIGIVTIIHIANSG